MVSIQDAISAIPAGRYIVAVSGGVDSMVLLHSLRLRPDVTVVVGHINHGIRADAAYDLQVIARFCESHNIIYETTALHLGPGASEALARYRRYEFLRKCLTKHGAQAIITAHHQDDLIETALINVLRGTGWRGIAPFVETSDVLRPLLNVSKKTIVAHAERHGLHWREDSTNRDQTYLRNYARFSIMPWLDASIPLWQPKIMRYIRKQQALRRTIEAELNELLLVYVKSTPSAHHASRYIWCMLPGPEAYELFQALCRRELGGSLIRRQAEAALLFIKVAKPGKRVLLGNNWQLRVTRKQFIVELR